MIAEILTYNTRDGALKARIDYRGERRYTKTQPNIGLLMAEVGDTLRMWGFTLPAVAEAEASDRDKAGE